MAEESENLGGRAYLVKSFASPLSCIPSVVMQKPPKGLNWTENADTTDSAEIA
jgi:hypothetical protein